MRATTILLVVLTSTLRSVNRILALTWTILISIFYYFMYDKFMITDVKTQSNFLEFLKFLTASNQPNTASCCCEHRLILAESVAGSNRITECVRIWRAIRQAAATAYCERGRQRRADARAWSDRAGLGSRRHIHSREQVRVSYANQYEVIYSSHHVPMWFEKLLLDTISLAI